MDLDTLLLVLTFVSFIGYAKQLTARKCHSNILKLKECKSDRREARCEYGLIFIQRVKYEDDNCNLFCGNTCCEPIDGSTSDDIRNDVFRECNNTQSCSLTSITSGTAIVDYVCIDTSSTSSTSSSTATNTQPTSMSTVTGTVITTAHSYSWMTSTPSSSYMTESSIAVSGTTFNSSTHYQTRVPVDKENVLPKGVIVAVAVVVVACVVIIPVAIILCRRYKNHRQQRNSDKFELEASPDMSSSHAYDVSSGPSYSPTVNSPARYTHQVHEAGNVYNTTTAVLDRANATSTDNEYDHLDHRNGQLTSNTAFGAASANNGDNVYDTTQTGTNVVVGNLTSNPDTVYDTSDHSGKTRVGDKSGNIENFYDTTQSTDIKNVDVQNCNVYDTTLHSRNTADNVYDTTRESPAQEENVYNNTGNLRGDRKKGYQNRSGETTEDYDVCNTSGVEKATQLDETYDTASSNQTVQEQVAVFSNSSNDDTYANLT